MLDYETVVIPNLEVVPGKSTQQDIKLHNPPRGYICGKVTDKPTGEPLRDVFVYAIPLLRTPRVFRGLRGRTDEDGEFVIIYVPTGTYILVAEKNGYKRGEAENVEVFKDKFTLRGFRLEKIHFN